MRSLSTDVENSPRLVAVEADFQLQENIIIGIDAEWVRIDAHRNRILSYQFTVQVGGNAASGIIYPPKEGQRLTFGNFLAKAISNAIAKKLISRWPDKVVVAAHWTRADLSAFKDFAKIKSQFDNVQKTYATTTKPFSVSCPYAKKKHVVAVTLVDTKLLVPSASQSLSALGKLYKFDKLTTGEKKVFGSNGDVIEKIPYIERMDLLLQDDPRLFEKYAIRDAEISALHTETMLKFAQTELGLNRILPTIGAMGVAHLRQTWRSLSIDDNAVLGREILSDKQFNPKTGRYITITKPHPLPAYSYHQALAVNTFYGGRNECFHFGPTQIGDWYEYDLTSAYPTAMAAIALPDYTLPHVTFDPFEFTPDKLGVAHLSFRFPDGTRFPCLPVRSRHDRGLIYPLSGETFATSPEISLAIKMGAEIEIKHGVIIPWRKNGIHPFREVMKDIGNRRALHDSGSLENLLWKQLGNSLYGKLAQGISGRRVYDTRTQTRQTILPSKITCPYLAGYVTGLVRAVVCELLVGIPDQRNVIAVTTDGFMTDATENDLNLSGELCTFFGQLRRRLSGQSQILETKFHHHQLLSWKVRGVATLVTGEGKPKLAKAGVRAPHEARSQNEWFIKQFLRRSPGDTWETEQPLSFPYAHETNADHVFETVTRRFSFEYDFKRCLIDPRMQSTSRIDDDGCSIKHISCTSKPWQTVEEFTNVRDMLEDWRHKHEGQLKSLEDWEVWCNYQAGATASQNGVRRSRKGVIDQARRLFLRAYARGEWGLPGQKYFEVAEWLSSEGYPTSEMDLKNAMRRGTLVENTIPGNFPGISDMVRKILQRYPNFEWWRMVDESGAAELCEEPPAKAA